MASSSLAEQLKKLAAAPQCSLLFQDRIRKSFLFEPSTIANLSTDEIYDIGITGLKALQSIQDKFEEFESLLFSEKLKNFERSVQTAEVNAELNKNINDFLTLLSPYFLLRSAHKALEWLIYRYHIHMFNIDAFICCILPYHETRYFVRALQIIDLDNPTGVWHWLQPLQKPGICLPKSTLFTHCYKELSFLRFVCEMVPNAIKIHNEDNSDLRLTISFYVSTVLGTLENSDGVTEAFLSSLLPYILKGLKSKNKDYCSASYMIICQLIRKSIIKSELLIEIVKRITKNLLSELTKEGILCLLIIYQHQQIKIFPKKSLFDIKNNNYFLDTLEMLSKEFTVVKIIIPILRQLIPAALKENKMKIKRVKRKHCTLFDFLKSFLNQIELPKIVVLQCIKILLMQQSKLCKSKTKKVIVSTELLQNKISTILSYLEKRYPDNVDEALEKYIQKVPNKCHLIQKVLNMSFSDPKHQASSDTNISLFLGVNHPSDSIRIISMKSFLEKVEKKELTDEDFIKNTILSRLEDRNPEIVLLVLSLGTNLFKIISEDLTSKIFIDLFNKDDENSNWFKIHKKAIELLCDYQFENKDQFLTIIFSHFLSKSIKDMKIVHSILTSNINNNYGLLLDVKEMLNIVKDKDFENIVTLNCKIIEMVGQSLLRMNANKTEILLNFSKLAIHLKERELSLNLIVALLFQYLVVHETEKETQLNIASEAIKYYYFLLKNNKLSSFRKADLLDEVIFHWIKIRKKKFSSDSIIFCLNSVIKSIKCSFEDMQLEWLDWSCQNMKNNQKIFIQLFNILTEYANSINSPLKNEFQSLLNEFFKIHLPILKFKIMFLSSLWPINFLPLSNKDQALFISSVQQIRALSMTTTIISTSKESMEWIFDDDSTVFFSLQIALTSHLEEVRKAGLSCLQSMIEKCNRKKSIHYQLANTILQKAEEVKSDPEQFFKIISLWYLSFKVSSKKDERFQPIIQQLYHKNTPNYIKHGLLFILKDVHSEELLIKLLPFIKSKLEKTENSLLLYDSNDFAIIQLLMSKYSPSVVNMITSSDCEAYLVLEKALKMSKICGTNDTKIQEIALSIFTKEFFSNIPSKFIQQKLLSELIDLYLSCNSSNYKHLLSKIIKKLCYNADLLVNELQKFSEIPAKTVKETKRIRLLKNEKSGSEILEEQKWKKIVFILEIIENKKQIEHTELLFPVIFDLFKRSLEIENHPSAEYLRQVILSSLFNCCQLLDDVHCLDEQKFQVEIIVQCIRISNNPQTQNQALLLLNLAAKLFPEHVLHNIMAIFTFMGANLIRQDNSYSFQVISQTLETIIPALLQASSQKQGDLLQTVASVTRVFVDALPDIPEHRRQPLFTKLLSILESREFLWVIIVQVFDICVTRKINDDNDQQETKIPSSIMDFILLLCQHYPADIQLITCIQITKYLLELPTENEIEAKKKFKEIPEPFNVSKHTLNQLKHFKYNNITFMVSLLSSQVFMTQVLNINFQKIDIDKLYEQFLEVILQYIQKTSYLIKVNNKDLHIKFWRALLHKCYDLLDKVNSLLPSQHFINVIKALVKHPISTVRRKSLEMLSAKLLHQQNFFTVDDYPALLSFIKPLIKIIKTNINSSLELNENESILNSQIAFYCLKLLCKMLGSSNPDDFKKVLNVIISIIQRYEISHHLTSSALLCLAEMCRSLSIHILPHLADIMPLLINILENIDVLKSNILLLISSITTVQHIVENLAVFLSGYLNQLLINLCTISTAISKTDDQNASVHQCLIIIFEHLALSVPARVLLPSIEYSYETVSTTNYKSIESLMFMFTKMLSSLEKSELNTYLPSLQKFLLVIFDFRCKNTTFPLKEIEIIEEYTIQAFGFLILKLSETTFRPLFLQLFDWATRTECKDRVLTFYKITENLAGKLKSLFVLFVGHFITNAAFLLEKNNNCKEEPYFANDETGIEKSCALLKHILSTLYKCFLYDDEKFVDKTIFNTVMQPLVDQIENDLGSDDDYQDRITNYVSPCIAQFAVALADDSLWKPLNYQIMLKTHHNSAKVRFATLNVLCELVKKLGENYLILLPESIPFLAELMEDESPEVEKQCHLILSDMEKVLNEPLMKYF